jgi:hypothetical protein
MVRACNHLRTRDNYFCVICGKTCCRKCYLGSALGTVCSYTCKDTAMARWESGQDADSQIEHRTLLNIAKKWDSLPPDSRRFLFRMGNTPLVYTNWDEMDAKQQSLVLNAARIIGSISILKYHQMFGGE